MNTSTEKIHRLKRGLELESEYRRLGRISLEDQDSFKFHDKILELGFPNVYEYERAKAFNYIGMNSDVITVHEVTPPESMGKILESVSKEQESIILAAPLKKTVYLGSDNFNRDAAIKRGFDIVEIGYSGGTIVTSNKDLNIGFVLKQQGGYDN